MDVLKSAKQGNVTEVYQFCNKHGVDMVIERSTGKRLIHSCIYHPELLRFIIVVFKCDIDAKCTPLPSDGSSSSSSNSSAGATAILLLCQAISEGKIDQALAYRSLKVLCDHGADLAITNADGQTGLSIIESAMIADPWEMSSPAPQWPWKEHFVSFEANAQAARERAKAKARDEAAAAAAEDTDTDIEDPVPDPASAPVSEMVEVEAAGGGKGKGEGEKVLLTNQGESDGIDSGSSSDSGSGSGSGSDSSSDSGNSGDDDDEGLQEGEEKEKTKKKRRKGTDDDNHLKTEPSGPLSAASSMFQVMLGMTGESTKQQKAVLSRYGVAHSHPDCFGFLAHYAGVFDDRCVRRDLSKASSEDDSSLKRKEIY